MNKLVNIFSRASMPYFENRRGHLLKQTCNLGRIKISITQGYRVEQILSNGDLLPLKFSNYDREFKDNTDRSKLQELFDECLPVDLSLFTNSTVTGFNFIMGRTKELLGELVVTQWQIDDAIGKLELAKSLLAERADISELTNLIVSINVEDLITSRKAEVSGILNKLNVCVTNGLSQSELDTVVIFLTDIKEQNAEFIKGSFDELITIISKFKEDTANEIYSENCSSAITEILGAYDGINEYIEVPAVHVDRVTETAKTFISKLLTKATEEAALAKYDELKGYDGNSGLVEEFQEVFKTVEESKYQEFIAKVDNFIEQANSGDPTELQAVLNEVSTMDLGTTKNEKNLKNKVREANELLATNKHAQDTLDKLVTELRALIEKVVTARKS